MDIDERSESPSDNRMLLRLTGPNAFCVKKTLKKHYRELKKHYKEASSVQTLSLVLVTTH